MDYSISVQNLSISYGDKTVIEHLNLNFKNNIFTALVGNNGSGKSTFFQTLSGFHKEYKGKINFQNGSAEQTQKPFKTGLLAYLSQNHSISFDVSVKELLLMGRFRFKKTFQNYNDEDLAKVEEIAKEIAIDELLKKSFLELSGGQQQLVLIAQTLVQDAQIYFFDEPTQNLDIKNASKIMSVIGGLAEKEKTVICSTHDLHLLENVNGEMVNFSADEIKIRQISSEVIKEEMEVLKRF